MLNNERKVFLANLNLKSGSKWKRKHITRSAYCKRFDFFFASTVAFSLRFDAIKCKIKKKKNREVFNMWNEISYISLVSLFISLFWAQHIVFPVHCSAYFMQCYKVWDHINHTHTHPFRIRNSLDIVSVLLLRHYEWAIPAIVQLHEMRMRKHTHA